MYDDFVDILKKDPVRNIAALGFFGNYCVKDAFRIGDTVLLLGKSDHLWAYISGTCKSELEELLKKFPVKTKYFASVEEWMKPVIAGESEIAWEMETSRFVLPESVKMDPPSDKTFRLDTSFVGHIFSNSDYSAFTSEEYIAERIERGFSAGILEGGTLAAWGLTHDDDSLGFLHVLPQFRGKGYARDITLAMVSQKRKEHKPAFLNIVTGNDKALKLVTGFGFEFDRKISWLKLK
ncbi:MAG TPA: GNAT family N-acetyltransferase [Bacteroidales bacterium]|nr:GNAT family N-acetyltransferase [Bacteroidales bacterium]